MGIFRDKQTGKYGNRIEHDGKDYKKIIGPDKRSAQLALQEIKREIAIRKLAGQKWDGFAKLQRAKRPKTFAEAAQEYMDERRHLKPSTLAGYESILKTNLLPEFGNAALSSITESSIRKFLSRFGERVSATRANTVTQLLRSIVGQAYRKGEIDRDPSLPVKRLQERRADIDPFSEEDLAIALGHVDEHYRPFFTTQAFTGARPNELEALRYKDIDWQNGTISISKGRVRGHEGLPKTRSGQRVIPMGRQVRDALEALKNRPGVRSIDDYVFTKPDGNPIDKHMDRIWARGLKRAGMRHRPSYQLRHTFITHCIIKGFPLPFIAKVVGHSTIDVLIRHYAGWIDSATKEQEQKLKEAFQGEYSAFILPEIKKPDVFPEGLSQREPKRKGARLTALAV